MIDLFLIFVVLAIVASVFVITLTAIVLMLLKEIQQLEDQLEANLPPF